MSSTYMMIMHIPRLVSLNRRHVSPGLTVKQKGSFFIVSQIFSKIVLQLDTIHKSLFWVGSSLLVIMMDQFPPLQLVTS